jgi:hypothetical protein
VHDNNEINSAEPGSEVYLLPRGLGMLLLGVDDVDVQQNRIEKNDFVGIGMIDWCVALAGPFLDPPDFSCFSGLEGANSAVDRARIVGNKFAGNHTGQGIGPAGPLPDPPFPPSDVLYVGADIFAEFVPDLPAGVDNCQSDNKLIKTPTPRNPGPLIIALPPDQLPAC